jgi:hypothetical protein
MKRKNIPPAIRLKLWVKSGGRCEFKGCNRPLWKEGLTLSDSNFAEVAHIIGASQEGPRGDLSSKTLQIEYDNLMLLCFDHHHLIDQNPQDYPVELLRQWKKEHEERIELLVGYADEIHQTTILKMCVKIHERDTHATTEQIRRAIRPRYPTVDNLVIEDNQFDLKADQIIWEKWAERRINQYLQQKTEIGLYNNPLKHISIFAIGPMPLLMYLGNKIGDTISCQIFPRHRNIEDTDTTWCWQNEYTAIEFNFQKLRKGIGSKAVLLISISDHLPIFKYESFWNQDEYSFYEISISEPSIHCLKHQKQLEDFSVVYRKALNEILAENGRSCQILLMPAIPAPLAIECGRVLLPTKDPMVIACQYYQDIGYKPVLRII